MKINYISYVDPNDHQGGGEMIAMDVINAGRKRGHTFSFSTVRPSYRIEYDELADLDIVVDLFNYPGTLKSFGAWRDFSDKFKENIIHRNRFIHYVNAYTDICNESYLPCSGDSIATCPSKSTMKFMRNIAVRDFSKACFSTQSYVRDFFIKSKLNIFLSPLHRDISLKVLNLDYEPPSFLLKPTVDSRRFFNQHLNRDMEYLFVGVIGEAKGLKQMRERFYNADIYFAGKLYPGTRLDFGTYLGSISYQEIPNLMNRAQNFVFLPRWPEPQGRVVIEAALCGCNLITNDLVGATSFPFDISKPENYSNSTQDLWEAMERLI